MDVIKVFLIISICIALLAVSPLVAGLCFDYSLEFITGADVPYWLDCLAGTFASTFVFPVTICCMVADCIGVESPLLDITKKESEKVPC